MLDKEKAKIILAQLEVVKAGMTAMEFAPYKQALKVLINTIRNDIGEMET